MSANEDLAVFPSTSFAASAKMLLQAAGIAGGIQALARRLRVPTKQLTSWMEGDELTPHTVFLRALDLLGSKPSLVQSSDSTVVRGRPGMRRPTD